MLPSSPTSCLPAPIKMSVIMCSSESSSLSSASHDSSCLAGPGNGPSWPIIAHKMSDSALRNQNRRSNKPIMEKRRRARINNCLNELKAILLDAMRKDPARHSKLEKADILELTVSHLKSLHRHSQHGGFHMSSLDASLKFREGFTECIAEVGRFLSTLTCDAASSQVTGSLLSHLADCIGDCNLSVAAASVGVEVTTENYLQNNNAHMYANTPGTASLNGNGHGGHGHEEVTTELNNNDVNVISKQPPPTQQQQPLLSLMPTRLPSGEFVFLFPGQSPSSVVTASQAQAQARELHLQQQQRSVEMKHGGHNHNQQSLPPPITSMSPEVPLELTISPTPTQALQPSPPLVRGHRDAGADRHHQQSVIATAPMYPITGAMMNGNHDRDRASFRKSHVHHSHHHRHGHGHHRQLLAMRPAPQHLRQQQGQNQIHLHKQQTLAAVSVASIPYQNQKHRHSSDRSVSHGDSRPLSLVTPKKDEATDMSCWRPW